MQQAGAADRCSGQVQQADAADKYSITILLCDSEGQTDKGQIIQHTLSIPNLKAKIPKALKFKLLITYVMSQVKNPMLNLM